MIATSLLQLWQPFIKTNCDFLRFPSSFLFCKKLNGPHIVQTFRQLNENNFLRVMASVRVPHSGIL